MVVMVMGCAPHALARLPEEELDCARQAAGTDGRPISSNAGRRHLQYMPCTF
jgi:hypothetical protein